MKKIIFFVGTVLLTTGIFAQNPGEVIRTVYSQNFENVASSEPIDTTNKDVVDLGLTIYKAPISSYAVRNKDYTVQVRNEGGKWHELFEYNAVNRNKRLISGSSETTLNNQTFAYFDSDFRNRIEVKVTKNTGTFSGARIRPTSYGIAYATSGNSINFFLDQPRNISVEFHQETGNSLDKEYDTFHNLLLYANGIEVNPPKEGDAGVTYFGPGFHDAGTINMSSGKTIYLAGGSIVKGKITGAGVSNSSIRGHGILLGSGNSGGSKLIQISNSDHITIQGVILIDSQGWTIVPTMVDSSLIQNVKIINQYVASDGSDPSGCTNLTYDNVFFRVPDDNISIKCHNVSRSNKNILIKNCVLWADAAHGILIGPEGTSGLGLTTSNVLITNCDFLEARSTSEYWGAVGITNGDNQTIQDITIEDCRVEDISLSNLVSIRVENKNQWIDAPGGPIKNIVFRNITFNGDNSHASYIKGLDATRCVDGVTFENLQINGQRIMSAQQGNFTVGPYATNVIFR